MKSLNRSRPLVALFLAAATCVGVTSCAGPSELDLAPYASVTAQLDNSTQMIVLPLDSFALSASEVNLVEAANAMLIDDCLSESGLSNPFVDPNWSSALPDEDRRYGLWNISIASQFGYEMAPSVLADNLQTELTTLPDTWAAAQEQCFATTTLLPVLDPDYADPTVESTLAVSIAGISEAYSYASGTPDWSSARDDWWDCMRTEGLTPRTGPTDWGPEVEGDLEGQIRIAVIDVTCKESTGLVQRLADLEAQYQQAFADENEAALLKQRERCDEIVAEARGVLGLD